MLSLQYHFCQTQQLTDRPVNKVAVIDPHRSTSSEIKLVQATADARVGEGRAKHAKFCQSQNADVVPDRNHCCMQTDVSQTRITQRSFFIYATSQRRLTEFAYRLGAPNSLATVMCKHAVLGCCAHRQKRKADRASLTLAAAVLRT